MPIESEIYVFVEIAISHIFVYHVIAIYAVYAQSNVKIWKKIHL